MASGEAVSRRELLRLGLALSPAALLLAACGGRGVAVAGVSSGPARQSGVDCVLAPEQTEGPYYLDNRLLRADITEGKPGAPLQLDLAVVDAVTCQPLADATVEVWHCDANGVYSGFGPGAGGQFLRG